MAKLLDPLLKSGVVSNETIFAADFAKKYGGANDKILMMPGPTWYAGGGSTSVLGSGTLGIPAGEMTAVLPLRWNKDPLTTGQVGGGPWVISKHTQNMAAAVDFVKWVTTTNDGEEGRRGLPGVQARRELPAIQHGSRPLLRRSSWAGDEGGRGPDLEGLEHGDLPGSALVVESRSSRSSSRASR